jgi:hypothetical protein
MHHQTTRQTTRRTYRTPSTSLNPYVLEETALTLTDIRRARDESESSSGRYPPRTSQDVRPYCRSPARRRLNIDAEPQSRPK